jgi:hypothetical protein
MIWPKRWKTICSGYGNSSERTPSQDLRDAAPMRNCRDSLPRLPERARRHRHFRCRLRLGRLGTQQLAARLFHVAVWGLEPNPLRVDLLSLTHEEQDLYDTLRDNPIRKGLRLEQELVGFTWVEKYLQNVLPGSGFTERACN